MVDRDATKVKLVKDPAVGDTRGFIRRDAEGDFDTAYEGVVADPFGVEQSLQHGWNASWALFGRTYDLFPQSVPQYVKSVRMAPLLGA